MLRYNVILNAIRRHRAASGRLELVSIWLLQASTIEPILLG